MATRHGNSFEDPEIRAKALEARRQNPSGRRNRTYTDIADPFAEVDTLGRTVGKKERKVKAQRATERAAEHVETLVDNFFGTVGLVLKNIRTRAAEGKDLSVAHQAFLGKFMDKILPDLRADAKSNREGKITKIIIGGQLVGAMSNGMQQQLAVGVQEETYTDE